MNALTSLNKSRLIYRADILFILTIKEYGNILKFNYTANHRSSKKKLNLNVESNFYTE